MQQLSQAEIPYYIVLVLGSVMSLIFCINRAKGFSVKNLMLKTVSSCCYLLTAVFALLSNPDVYIYGSLLIFGGTLGLCGDIMLDLKGIYDKDKSKYLYAGFIFFLIGHVFYVAAIIYQSKMYEKWWVILLCLLFCVLFSIGNIASAKIMKVHFGAYKTIVFIYTIFLMMTFATGFAAMIITHFQKRYIMLAIGAAMFALSDVILSGTFFGKGKDRPVHYFTNHLTYYAAQYIIAASILFM